VRSCRSFRLVSFCIVSSLPCTSFCITFLT
jgi:hypothetical protein